MSRRPLGEVLGEVASGTLDAVRATPGVRVRQITVTLPVELGLHRSGDQVRLLGDLPRLVTRTDFDIHPDRVQIIWAEREPA